MPPGADHDCENNNKLELDATLHKGGPFGLRTSVVWPNIFKFIYLHFLAICGIFVAPYASWKTWVFFVFYNLISNLGVTAGAHRLWAHRSYKATLFYRIMIMLFNCISFQNPIYVWVRDHRVHHKYTETDADPHNAKRGFFFAHMGWLMMKKHPEVFLKGCSIDMSDIQCDSVVMFQKRYYYILAFIMSLLIPTVAPWYIWGEYPLYSFLICGMLRYVYSLHNAWLVNSAAHLWGKRPYNKNINPSENWLVSLVAIGEGWHNYHHSFPYDYAASEWGPKINITTCFIDFCAFLGFVYDRKQVSAAAIDQIRRKVGDLSSQ